MKREPHDLFGSSDPRKMLGHFFSGAVRLEYRTARRADVSRQDYTVAPRHWYLDAWFTCGDCRREFVWSAREQQFWFETLRFYVDTQATRCRACRSRRRRIAALRKNYDATVGEARGSKSTDLRVKVIGIVNHLESLGGEIPAAMQETRALFRRLTGI